jgi:hypothetical protein
VHTPASPIRTAASPSINTVGSPGPVRAPPPCGAGDCAAQT